jgi:hypothetical protein
MLLWRLPWASTGEGAGGDTGYGQLHDDIMQRTAAQFELTGQWLVAAGTVGTRELGHEHGGGCQAGFVMHASCGVPVGGEQGRQKCSSSATCPEHSQSLGGRLTAGLSPKA